MALFDVHFFSEALGMQSTVEVVLPQRSTVGQIGLSGRADEGRYRVLYLLHGLSDDETIWMRRTSIERYAAEYGIAVVMPNGHRSFYTDMRHGGAYFDFLTRELPLRMQEFFRISDRREDTFIAGLSMGGYGALKAALRCPDRYARAAGLSAVADIREFCGARPAVAEPIFGSAADVPESDDLFALARAGKARANKPELYLGVGLQDALYPANRRLLAELQADGYAVTYRESEGNHNWAFWDEYVRYVLAWMFG